MLKPLIELFYPLPDALVGVLDGIVEELQGLVPKAKHICRIYNPVFSNAIFRQTEISERPDWWNPVGPPTILAVCRLAPENIFRRC